MDSLVALSIVAGLAARAGRVSTTDRVTRAEFFHATRGYVRHARGYDELEPLSRTARDWYGESPSMKPVDTPNMLILMGLTADAERQKVLIVERRNAISCGDPQCAGPARLFW